MKKEKIKRINKKNYKNDQKWLGNIKFLPKILIVLKISLKFIISAQIL